MRPRHLAPLAVLALAACSPPATSETTPPPEPAPTVTVTETPEPAPTVTVTATPDPEPTEPVAGPPAGCDLEPPETDLAQSITDTPLPETAGILNVQEVRPHSDHPDQDDIDVVVRICSPPLNTEAHQDAATDIAVQVRDHEDAGAINSFRVSLWMPTGDGDLRQGRILMVDDYQSYTWDQESAVVDISHVWETPNG